MRKRTQRKHWNTAYNPVKAAVFAHLYKGDVLAMEVQELFTVDELKAGKLTAQGVHVMQCMCAISRRLADEGVGPEVIDVCKEVTQRLEEAVKAKAPTPELVAAAGELYEYHKAQRELAGPTSYGIAAAPFCRLTI